MDLDAKIEALLFHKTEPMSLGKIAEAVETNPAEVEEALNTLEQKLEERGIVLLKKDNTYMLGTSPAASDLIEKVTKDELSADLGRAGLETLAIIAYEGPISRPEIDYIRGVNSSFILRNLMVRGLIERVPDKNDSRRFLYRPTFELLRYLGVSEASELPEFESIREKINDFKKQEENGTDRNHNEE
ncbi:MAG TPA: SMC-Scp complex subunit ScpB [Candidatus Paceibacterota bacterium]|jgi:segregation and condensation protein B|nr:SMC-Scp complex subunit ScpB [Candidatus Paceibacterota bacterium]